MPAHTELEAIDSYLDSQMRDNHIPGLAVSIIRNGSIYKSSVYGFANLELDIAANEDTAFQIASSTKMLTGLVLMRLVERNVLSLNESITKYLVDVPPQWQPITIRNLATHTSGLLSGVPVPGKPGIAGDPNILTADQVTKYTAGQPLSFQPNAKSEYGLIDFTVLTNTMERVTGKSFSALLKELVTGPLGMTSTGFDNRARSDNAIIGDMIPRRAALYYWQQGGQKTFDHPFASWSYSSGGLFSTIRDLARLFIALDRNELISEQSREEMWTRPVLTDGNPGVFGVGWVVGHYRGRLAVGHSGGPALSDIILLPRERLAVIALTNQVNMSPHIAQGIIDLLLPVQAPSK